MGLQALASSKKNCKRRRGWLVFVDEAGFSQKPSVRSTWAPRGETPILNHSFNWKKMSMCAGLAYRWDGLRSRLYFKLKPGSFDSPAIVEFLKDLKKHFRGFHVTLIWDGLAAHKSLVTKEFLEKQRHWLSIERLPAYAPDLNPVEYVWSNLKSNELANNCADDISEASASTVSGLKRIKKNRALAFSFLEHAGLSI